MITAVIIYVLSLRQQLNSQSQDRQMERYRSGHNEAVLKTVCPQGRVGSNPTLSASKLWIYPKLFLYLKLLGISVKNIRVHIKTAGDVLVYI